MHEHISPISGVDNFLDKYIATAGYDNKIVLWDFLSKKPISSNTHEHLVNHCKFSNCGNYLLSSSSDYTSILWKIPEMEMLTKLQNQTDDVEMSIFHPTQEMIATASRDSFIRTYDFSGKLLNKFEGHTADVLSIAWTNDAQNIVSSSDDGTIKIWDLKTGKNISDINLQGVETDTICVVDSDTIFAGNDLGEIITINGDQLDKIKAHDAGIKRLYYNSQSEILISSSYDKKIKIWKIFNGKIDSLICESDIPPIVWPRSCCMVNDHQLIFATFGSSFAVFDLIKREWEFDHIKKTNGINAVTVDSGIFYSIGDSGDFYENKNLVNSLGSLCNFIIKVKNNIFTGGQTGEIFEAKSGKIIYKNKSPLNCATHFVKDGISYVLVGTYTGECVILKEFDHEFTYYKTVKLHENAIKGISTNGKVIFSVCANKSIAFHSVQDFSLLKEIQNAQNKIINSCIYLEDDKFMSISRDLNVKIWDHAFHEVETIQTEHTNSLKCIGKSSDNRIIAVGSYNGSVHLWDRTNKVWFHKEKVTKSGISSICFHNENKSFIASSYDGRIYEIKYSV